MESDQSKIHNENNQDDATAAAPQHRVPSNRHVRFPEDDSIILGCLEPFRPTPDNCTSDELIAAYIASCKLYKTPIVDFLLEQLRGIDLSICNERYSRLCLRGIKLSRFQIETLEEVFRRVHFQEVDLEDTFLDEASATALFDMMLHYETCVDLSISLNLEKFGPSIAWPRCITYLRKSAALQGFKLSHTPLVTNLFSGLSLSGLSLKSLTFRDCALTGPPLHCLLRLLRYLMTYTDSRNDSGPSKASAGANGSRYPRLPYRGPMAPMPWGLSLRLPENRIHGVDAESLLLLVRHQLVLLPGPPTPDNVAVNTASACKNKLTGGSGYLEELDLSHNSLRDEGVQVLCSGLLQAYELQHRRLEVALAAIAQATSTSGTSSAPAIMPPKCALPQARGLQRLNLADNALGNGRAGRHLAVVLRCSNERLAPLLGGLTHLDLSDNPGFGSIGVVDLCDGLVRNFTLRELYLRNVRIGFDGVFALSGYIGETKSLIHLDVRQNAIDMAGMMALTRTLKVNGSLTALLLDARRPTLPYNEEHEMIRILLQELEGYLRRNRSSKVVLPSTTPPKELETFPPKTQTAIEHVSSTYLAEDINNFEEMEIKEILLDPPKPAVTHANDASSYWGSKRIKEIPAEQLMGEAERVSISGMESGGNESLELSPKWESMKFHPNDSSSLPADVSGVEEVGPHITTEPNQSETESIVRDLSIASVHLKSDDALSIVSQPESEDLADEPSTNSEALNLNHKAIAVSQSNDASSAILANTEAHALDNSGDGEPKFEGLGSEPPMEFETFLMAQKGANHAMNMVSSEVEETPVNSSIHGQFFDDPDKEAAIVSEDIYLDSSDMGVEVKVFQSGHLETTVCHSNDGANKGSSELEGNSIDSPITDGAKMEHISEPREPTTKDSESDNVVDLNLIPAEGNDTMAFRSNGKPALRSNIVDGDVGGESPTKMGTPQAAPLESIAPNSNAELNETSAELNGESVDLYDTEEATIAALDVRKPEFETPQAATIVDQTSGALDPSSIDVEESSVNLLINEEAKILIPMDTTRTDIGGFTNAPPIESKKSTRDNLDPVMLQPKNTQHQDFFNNVDVKNLKTGQVVESPSEIKGDLSMAAIFCSSEERSKGSRKLGENPADLITVEDVKISTTPNNCNPKVGGSWSLQAVEAMDFSATDVKESPISSSDSKELNTSANAEAGQFDVEDLGDELTIGFEAFQSHHSKSANLRTNCKLEKGPAEVGLRISPSLGAQTREIDRENQVKVGNLLLNPPISTLSPTSQKSSSEDLLKEAMQQYLNPDLVAEVRHEDVTAIPQSAFTERTPVTTVTKRSANLDLETSESDDSLFDETSDSPKTTKNPLSCEVKEETFSKWAENRGVLGDKKEKGSNEGTCKKDSFVGEEAYWGDAEWDDNNAGERTGSSKTDDQPQPDSNKCMKVGDENTFEDAEESVLGAKVSQTELGRAGSGFEASVKIGERSFYPLDSSTKIEVVDVPTATNWRENTDDGEVKSSAESQSGLHSRENLSNGESHLPSPTSKNGDGRSDKRLHQLTNEERISTTLDNTNAGDMGSFVKTSQHFEESHIEKSVCVAKCDTFTGHLDDVLLRNTDWGVFGESNRCTTTNSASGLTASGEENMEDAAYSDLKIIPKGSDEPSAFAPIEASKSSNFIATSTKPISPDNEVTESAEFTDFSAPEALVEPKSSAVAQKETVDERTGHRNDVLDREKAFEELQLPIRGDENLGFVKVNFGSSQLSLALRYEENEVPDSVLKQLCPAEGVINSTIMEGRQSNLPAMVVRDLGGEAESRELSEGAEDVGMRLMGGFGDFSDPVLIETERYSGEVDATLTLNGSPDTRPLEESGLDTAQNAGCQNSSDNSSSGDETESESLSSPLKTNFHGTSGGQFLRCPPDSVHESESVALPGDEAKPVLRESFGGMVSKLSEEGVSFKPSMAFSGEEKAADQIPGYTSLEKSKLDTEDVSWANYEGVKSFHQIDEGRVLECRASPPHEEPSTTSWTAVELSGPNKDRITCAFDERTATHEPSKLLYAGDSHFGSEDERSGVFRVLPLDDKHFNSLHGEDEVIGGDESGSKLLVSEEMEIKSSGIDRMDLSHGDSIDGANRANFSSEIAQTSVVNDARLLAPKLLTEYSPPLSVSTGPLEPMGTLGKVNELLEKPLEDVHSFKDLISGEFALKNKVESAMLGSFGAKEGAGDAVIGLNFAVQEEQFNESGPISQSVKPEIPSPAAEHGTENKPEEEFHFKEPVDFYNLQVKTTWRDDQLSDLESALTEASGLEINTKSDEPAIGCKVDSNGSDGWEVDNWGPGSERLLEPSDQFRHADLLNDTTPSRDLGDSHAASMR
ncbi:Protein phosphatase 1 regulatory subunit 37 [Taenia crassiceps]|uniref:Protein phosphatase 1 regulatory subunit 37 n=1 Tax=Taenia crassiceps TaxID=6207 RepID=A0ABR4QUL4_9CEST